MDRQVSVRAGKVLESVARRLGPTAKVLKYYAVIRRGKARPRCLAASWLSLLELGLLGSHRSSASQEMWLALWLSDSNGPPPSYPRYD